MEEDDVDVKDTISEGMEEYYTDLENTKEDSEEDTEEILKTLAPQKGPEHLEDLFHSVERPLCSSL